jgi:hypothetical protein
VTKNPKTSQLPLNIFIDTPTRQYGQNVGMTRLPAWGVTAFPVGYPIDIGMPRRLTVMPHIERVLADNKKG